jgi:hypothetical protein
VAVLYDIYRYPFRINDSSTSSTYRDTPLTLQAGKYALLGVLALILLVYAIRNRSDLARPRRVDLLLVALGSYAFIRACIAGLSNHSTASLHVVLPLVCGVPFAVAAACWVAAVPGRAATFVRAAVAFGGAVVALHALANIAEIGAWITTGRLPALAKHHGLVRFGGVWDDPNGCAAFSALVVTAILGGALQAGRRLTAIVLAAALFNIVVAWSFSGWLVLLVGLVGVGVPKFGWRRVGGALVLLAATAALFLGLAAAAGTSVSAAASSKLTSASERLQPAYHYAVPNTGTGWLIGLNNPPHLEDAFGSWLSATGAVGFALLVAWLIDLIWTISRGQRYWLLIAAVGFLAASVFVPLFLVFPVGFLVLLLVSGASSEAPQEIAARSPASAEAS